MSEQPIPVGITARHVHLSRAHAEALFGAGHELLPVFPLTQPGEVACAETVTVRGPKGALEHVRIVAPLRERTQVELTVRDQAKIGVEGPLRLSSDLSGSFGCTLEGPAGTIVLAEGVLNAMRHLHVSPEQAKELGLTPDSTVTLWVGSDRTRVVRDVLVRVRPGASLELHLDPEEASAADVGPRTQAWLLPPSAE